MWMTSEGERQEGEGQWILLWRDSVDEELAIWSEIIM